jgi:hypothetical protein
MSSRAQNYQAPIEEDVCQENEFNLPMSEDKKPPNELERTVSVALSSSSSRIAVLTQNPVLSFLNMYRCRPLRFVFTLHYLLIICFALPMEIDPNIPWGPTFKRFSMDYTTLGHLDFNMHL